MREKSGVGSDACGVGGVCNQRDSFSVAMQKMIIRMYPQLTLKASPLNSRGSVRPTDRVRVVTSTLNGSPNSWAALRSEQRGDPFRVDVPLVVLSAGHTDPRLLSGDP